MNPQETQGARTEMEMQLPRAHEVHGVVPAGRYQVVERVPGRRGLPFAGPAAFGLHGPFPLQEKLLDLAVVGDHRRGDDQVFRRVVQGSLKGGVQPLRFFGQVVKQGLVGEEIR
jgi:hypothetical protein